MPHFILTHAVNLTSDAGGGRFTFGADCRPCEELVDAARDTDLLLVEATLPRPERTGIRGHLTPGEAGEHARRAGAKRVVLTSPTSSTPSGPASRARRRSVHP